MFNFPITDLLDETECYHWLVHVLHPEGLKCRNGHALPEGQAPHDRSRAPIVRAIAYGHRLAEYFEEVILVPTGL